MGFSDWLVVKIGQSLLEFSYDTCSLASWRDRGQLFARETRKCDCMAQKPAVKPVRTCRVNFLTFSRLMANSTGQVNKY